MENQVKKQLMDECSILKINSPVDRLRGPFDIVYKNEVEGWAIVTICWDDTPTLGIRWFWGEYGMPVTYGHPQWFVIPQGLHESIINQLQISISMKKKVIDFLSESK